MGLNDSPSRSSALNEGFAVLLQGLVTRLEAYIRRLLLYTCIPVKAWWYFQNTKYDVVMKKKMEAQTAMQRILSRRRSHIERTHCDIERTATWGQFTATCGHLQVHVICFRRRSCCMTPVTCSNCLGASRSMSKLHPRLTLLHHGIPLLAVHSDVCVTQSLGSVGGLNQRRLYGMCFRVMGPRHHEVWHLDNAGP
jgi:hypothetical protein